MKPIITSVASADDIAVTAQLARRIWNEHYVSLIGQAQVDYMVERFQSAEAITRQIEEGIQYFLIGSEAGPVGYFAIRPEEQTRSMFLSKLYVDKPARGRGIAAAVMEYIEDLCRANRLSKLWLTVNKGNSAIEAYQRLGFEITEPIVMDIGNGFVMDDFRMEKTVTGVD